MKDPDDTQYARSELLSRIRDLGGDLGRKPTAAEMDAADGYPSSATYYRRFESWNDAVKQAGFDPYNQQLSREVLLDHLRELAEELGHPPTVDEMDAADGRPAHSTFLDHFHTWNDATRSAGLEPRTSRGPR